jgi:hypothetical protein
MALTPESVERGLPTTSLNAEAANQARNLVFDRTPENLNAFRKLAAKGDLNEQIILVPDNLDRRERTPALRPNNDYPQRLVPPELQKQIEQAAVKFADASDTFFGPKGTDNLFDSGYLSSRPVTQITRQNLDQFLQRPDLNGELKARLEHLRDNWDSFKDLTVGQEGGVFTAKSVGAGITDRANKCAELLEGQ